MRWVEIQEKVSHHLANFYFDQHRIEKDLKIDQHLSKCQMPAVKCFSSIMPISQMLLHQKSWNLEKNDVLKLKKR